MLHSLAQILGLCPLLLNSVYRKYVVSEMTVFFAYFLKYHRADLCKSLMINNSSNMLCLGKCAKFLKFLQIWEQTAYPVIFSRHYLE